MNPTSGAISVQAARKRSIRRNKIAETEWVHGTGVFNHAPKGKSLFIRTAVCGAALKEHRLHLRTKECFGKKYSYEDRGNISLRNVCIHLQIHKVL
jgi:hypothetical protein